MEGAWEYFWHADFWELAAGKKPYVVNRSIKDDYASWKWKNCCICTIR